MKFSPIKASEEIAEKYKRYLTTIFEIADKDYAEQLNQELSRKNVLYRGPYLDATDSFKTGRSIRELIDTEILPKMFKKFGFPLDRPLYIHQETALLKCLAGKILLFQQERAQVKRKVFCILFCVNLQKKKKKAH